MNNPQQDITHTLGNGIAGVLATVLSVATSILAYIEQWMRISSLAVGITVGLITLYNLTKTKK